MPPVGEGVPSLEDRTRDYLANERTYLAYLRTALAFIAFGFVIARFSLFAREISVVAHIKIATTHASTAFGAAMAAAGILAGLYGSFRYTTTHAAIRANNSTPMPPWAAVAGGILVGAVGVVVALAIFEVR
jgi:putative membrane protein